MKRLLTTLLLIVLTFNAMAQKAPKAAAPDANKTRVLLILDCSHSMWDRWQSDAKIKVTQRVLLKFIDSVAHQQDLEVALRVFGHLNRNDYGTRLEVPFAANNKAQLQSKIKTLVPNGGCTVSTALEHSLNDFPVVSADKASRNIILIITDGMDDCDGNICQVARQVQLSGVVVQTFILGIGSAQSFQSRPLCAGTFTHVPDEEDYTQALYDIFSLSEEEARVVLQLTDQEGHLYPTETPVALYDAQTQVVKYSTLYAVGSRLQPDTLVVDPLVAYDIEVFSKPRRTLRGQRFAPGEVTVLPIVMEQGTLRLRHEERRSTVALPAYPIVVRQHGESAVLNTQQMGETLTYLAGSYDIEVLSTPPLLLRGIEIQANALTDLTIPRPGIVNVQKPKTICSGSIFSLVEGRLEWVCDLNPSKAMERLLLMPGDYQLVLHPQQSIRYKDVATQRFTVGSGETTNITF